MEYTRIDVGSLNQLSVDVFSRAGVSLEDAGLASRIFDRGGHDGVGTHGVLRLDGYVDRLRSGGMNRNAKVSVRSMPPRLPWSTATTAWARWWGAGPWRLRST